MKNDIVLDKSIIQIYFDEKVRNKRSRLNVYWLQGEFCFGRESRVATITGVQFISPSLIVAAHREAAKLYLIKIINNTYKIIDEIIMNVKLLPGYDKYYHPDLMIFSNNYIYLSEFTNRLAIYKYQNNRLKLYKLVEVGDYKYHACYANESGIYLGSVLGGIIQHIDKKSYEIKSLKIDLAIFNEEKIRMKTIIEYDGFFILGLDSSNSNKNSFIALYMQNHDDMLLLDCVVIRNAQIDGACLYEGNIFLSLHNGDYKKGQIYVINLIDKKIKVIHKVFCHGFPHGLDVFDGKIAYTSYKEKSIFIHDLTNFFKSNELI
ncbi:hypothetical protein ACFPDQ_03350 [Pseudofrancisella aestuarii]|uniref:DUF4915 domain-containing protein n=1 Tax=Pseudofrancisella aestuarii TaxID=2670347 RepID=A0ABV9TAD5_9GAMM|nr:hypothetical protein [Pseudofrancisella aestuarii]